VDHKRRMGIWRTPWRLTFGTNAYVPLPSLPPVLSFSLSFSSLSFGRAAALLWASLESVSLKRS
jgi:hypothetical protein